MESQKIINLLDNTPNEISRFRAITWVEVNDDARGRYNTNSQIKFKTSMLRSNISDYSDAYIFVEETINVLNTAAAAVVIFKNFAPFRDCISKINNTQIDNATDFDVVMLMYSLIEYRDNYSKAFGILWQYCREGPAINNNGNIVIFSKIMLLVCLKFRKNYRSNRKR